MDIGGLERPWKIETFWGYNCWLRSLDSATLWRREERKVMTLGITVVSANSAILVWFTLVCCVLAVFIRHLLPSFCIACVERFCLLFFPFQVSYLRQQESVPKLSWPMIQWQSSIYRKLPGFVVFSDHFFFFPSKD
jgi:hypothetical protein